MIGNNLIGLVDGWERVVVTVVGCHVGLISSTGRIRCLGQVGLKFGCPRIRRDLAVYVQVLGNEWSGITWAEVVGHSKDIKDIRGIRRRRFVV